MPTTDNSYAAKITQLRGRTLAAFHRANPNSQEFKNAQYPQEERGVRIIGSQTVVVNGVTTENCCGCTETVGTFSISQTNVGTLVDGFWIMSFQWTAAPNATSYTVTTSYPNATIIRTSDLTANVRIPEADYPNDLIPVPVTVTAIRDCASLPKTISVIGCFLAGALVSMADGTQKAIEDVRVGDKVIGAFGEINEVLALHRPILANSQMCCINGEHHTSDHHPHVSVNRKFYTPKPGVIDGDVYGKTFEVLGKDNQIEERFLSGLRPGRVEVLHEGILLKTVDGSKVVKTIEMYDMDPETQLYNLVIGGSHTYCVDGYAVTGWPSEEDFNYDRWMLHLPPIPRAYA